MCKKPFFYTKNGWLSLHCLSLGSESHTRQAQAGLLGVVGQPRARRDGEYLVNGWGSSGVISGTLRDPPKKKKKK
jgi:hypothetical protein